MNPIPEAYRIHDSEADGADGTDPDPRPDPTATDNDPSRWTGVVIVKQGRPPE